MLRNFINRAYIAHDCAYFDYGILHRDVSVGNTFMTYDGKGLLIYWDIATRLPQMCADPDEAQLREESLSTRKVCLFEPFHRRAAASYDGIEELGSLCRSSYYSIHLY